MSQSVGTSHPAVSRNYYYSYCYRPSPYYGYSSSSSNSSARAPRPSSTDATIYAHVDMAYRTRHCRSAGGARTRYSDDHEYQLSFRNSAAGVV